MRVRESAGSSAVRCTVRPSSVRRDVGAEDRGAGQVVVDDGAAVEKKRGGEELAAVGGGGVRAPAPEFPDADELEPVLAPRTPARSSSPRGPEGAPCAAATATETAPVVVASNSVAAPPEGAVRDDDGAGEGSADRMPATTAVAPSAASAERGSAGTMPGIGVAVSPPGAVGTPGVTGITGEIGGRVPTITGSAESTASVTPEMSSSSPTVCTTSPTTGTV